MSHFQSLAAPWSRSARREDIPRTPEPNMSSETLPPSPPRPRFRIKRRNASNLNAPTEQFLASVAAADIPIPSIEEPRVLDEEMEETLYPVSHFNDLTGMPFTPHEAPGRMFSPPKTPAPDALPTLSTKQYPNWSIDSTLSSLDSSPDYESSRPSTAHSTHTNASLLSYFSISSEDLSQCVSPENEKADVIDEASTADDNSKTLKPAKKEVSKETIRRAPWTKPMNQHLWSTYMMYLQDPKVTPFRIGKSGIPPHGVCLRVARESRRSWKGSKAQGKVDIGSGSITPTQGAAGPYVQWPHTCAATRAQLRELCKMDARSKTRGSQYKAPSPAPFKKSAVRYRNRRAAPARSPSVFSGQDMAISLAVSTSDSMQLHGPLAQLTNSEPEPRTDELSLPPPNNETLEPPELARPRLASPFGARSYGPSSSSSLPSSFAVDSKLQRQTHTGGPRRGLMSPVRLTRSRSTHKRRPNHLETRKIKRPSLGSDLWVDPASLVDLSATQDQFTPQTEPKINADVVVPRKNLQKLFEASQYPPAQERTLAHPFAEMPPRLGSPFALGGSSFSFPNRLSHGTVPDSDAGRRPFATVQQSSDSNTGGVTRESLASRLAYIDERLKDFRRRDKPRRRSESPL
ncbi:hypothetical protein FPSE_01478 [Fusarium pseudograminearum CS3096]|uniref:Uncharacterized protein n=1 Tax=Fusarium pseudograminearum (strain CS3096) TaxID=1028729 RepID=K3VVE1_FUSPC|nr:hypothetical protein FPSE_01478 [Fusarium pseudograminearum CS3096]EKJ78373.1 hypothetical protein FPSE_01478 [Fusarium pseudograminearum CS3096]KAF0643634.1 hypothetical protein FPSE5266_01478 [Fusarium pseudograminearum]